MLLHRRFPVLSVARLLALLVLLLAVADWIGSYLDARSCEYRGSPVEFIASPVLGATFVALIFPIKRHPGWFALCLVLAVAMFAFIVLGSALSGEFAGYCGNF